MTKAESRLIRALRYFNSPVAASNFISLVSIILAETGITPDSLQLGITIRKNRRMIGVNIGSRWAIGLHKSNGMPVFSISINAADLDLAKQDSAFISASTDTFSKTPTHLVEVTATNDPPLSKQLLELWFKAVKDEIATGYSTNVPNPVDTQCLYGVATDDEKREFIMSYVLDPIVSIPEPNDEAEMEISGIRDIKLDANDVLWKLHFDNTDITVLNPEFDPGPIGTYTDVATLRKAIGSNKKSGNAKQWWAFYHAPIGARVFATRGKNEILNVGVINGNYQYSKEGSDIRHHRSIKWLANKHLDFRPYLSEINKKTLFLGTAFNATRKGSFIIRKYLEAFPEYKTIFDEHFTKVPATVKANMSSETKQHALNTILYGPPGTGKTWSTIDLAVEIVTGQNQDHAGNKIEFDRLRQEGQIEFITFHQNYSYEDFMVGLRPDVDHEILRFQSHKGIFYEMCRKARLNFESSMKGQVRKRTFDEVFYELVMPIEQGKEVEIKMKSGDKYAITDVTDRSIAFRKPSGSTTHTLSISTLEDIVDGVRSINSGLQSYYTPLAQFIIEKQGTAANSKPPNKYVLIIDEINRGNISRIFGELITLLEEDKRIGRDNELLVTLPNGEKGFGVPPNLYIIGTMNTADKSIALLDIALRRRFDFLPKYPEYDKLTPYVAEKLQKLNTAILETKKSPDFMIGHAFFINRSDSEFHLIMNRKIVPLLYEYFNGREEFVRRILEKMEISIRQNTITQAWEVLPS